MDPMHVMAVLSLPVRRQRQGLVSKKVLKKHSRQMFNNKSLTAKIRTRRLEKLTTTVVLR